MRTLSPRLLALAVLLAATLFPAAAPAQSDDESPAVDSLIAQARTALTDGVTLGDATAVMTARATFERAATGDTRTALAHYYVALADYRLVDLAGQDDEDERDRFLDDAQDHLERAVELRPEWAEAHALLSTVYGRKAGGGMISGMRYGPKADRALAKAQKIAPRNPRVILAEAISLYNKPGAFGGDKEKAVARLQDAIAQFEQAAPADALAPRWGHAEAYAWLGIAHTDADRPDAARTAFETALDVRPGYAWVEKALLPKLAAR